MPQILRGVDIILNNIGLVLSLSSDEKSLIHTSTQSITHFLYYIASEFNYIYTISCYCLGNDMYCVKSLSIGGVRMNRNTHSKGSANTNSAVNRNAAINKLEYSQYKCKT